MWELIERFGLKAIIGLIIVGAGVWLITHLIAKEDKEVSILGIAKYTKKENKPQPPQLQSKGPEEKEISLTGCITSPPSGSQTARWFQVEGTIHGQHRHLWLIERVGQLYWPKKPKLKPQNGRWAGEVNEGGCPQGGRFEILLVDVSNKVDRRFCEWFGNGYHTEHYPGLHSEEIGDANILDFREYQLIME
ncbi:hypothetical protein KKE26_04340 [bacterium]|nr:hypothetical protein [bacterium]